MATAIFQVWMLLEAKLYLTRDKYLNDGQGEYVGVR
jgi:hypothetical protein